MLSDGHTGTDTAAGQMMGTVTATCCVALWPQTILLHTANHVVASHFLSHSQSCLTLSAFSVLLGISTQRMPHQTVPAHLVAHQLRVRLQLPKLPRVRLGYEQANMEDKHVRHILIL